MTKQKSLLIILCIIGLSALVFSQCIGSTSKDRNPSTVGQKETGASLQGVDPGSGEQIIRASVAMSPSEFELFSKMAEDFSSSREGIRIVAENVPVKEAYETWKKAGQIGEAPDMMLLDNTYVQEFAALGFLQPMDPFFSSDQQNGRISTLINQVKWNGYIWGVPKDVDPYILVWNPATAEKLGFDQAPRSPEELLSWNHLMMKPDEGQYGIYMDPEDPYAFIALASALTGGWFEGGRIWPDETAAVQQLGKFFMGADGSVPNAEWNGKSYSLAYPELSDSWSPWEKLAEGNLGAWLTTVSYYKQRGDSSLKLAAIPAYTEQEHGVWLKGRSFTISSRSQHAQILMDWIKEVTTPEAEILYWNQAKLLPAQIPSYSLNPLRGDEHIKSFDWLLSQGKVLPPSVESSVELSSLKAKLKLLWSGEISLEEFVQATNESWVPEAAKE